MSRWSGRPDDANNASHHRHGPPPAAGDGGVTLPPTLPVYHPRDAAQRMVQNAGHVGHAHRTMAHQPPPHPPHQQPPHPPHPPPPRPPPPHHTQHAANAAIAVDLASSTSISPDIHVHPEVRLCLDENPIMHCGFCREDKPFSYFSKTQQKKKAGKAGRKCKACAAAFNSTSGHGFTGQPPPRPPNPPSTKAWYGIKPDDNFTLKGNVPMTYASVPRRPLNTSPTHVRESSTMYYCDLPSLSCK